MDRSDTIELKEKSLYAPSGITEVNQMMDMRLVRPTISEQSIAVYAVHTLKLAEIEGVSA